MNILENIIASKKIEVEQLYKKGFSFFEKSSEFKSPSFSLKQTIITFQTNIIAEFKRKSPSKGNINLDADVNIITQQYQNFGASAISILTDKPFFGGSNADIINERKNINLPILKKDFIIDEIQILEAKAIGADVILLIASCLTKSEVKHLSAIAKNVGLEVLLELHHINEIDHLCTNVDFVGINNRNLKTFDVTLEHSIAMRTCIGNEFIAVAESGISSVTDVQLLHNAGFDVFLIGEYLMKQSNISEALTNLKNVTK
jgi:indole-3-glycerol phosphate synthase